jgi:hypothetical protein
LLIWACNTARMCRVSTQITGKPASASGRRFDRWRFWVLRVRLMVKRGPHSRPQASEGEAASRSIFGRYLAAGNFQFLKNAV